MRSDANRSFVIADIPGLIEGAAEGAGLGHQFLRHLQRTRMLLHVVDLSPFDPDADPAINYGGIGADNGSIGPMAELTLLLIPAFLVPNFVMLHIAMLAQARHRAAAA